jgi:hypothetical protein
MKIIVSLLCLGALAANAGPALTIYNQNFAVVRDTVPLDLKSGANAVIYSGATAQVEPDSVILRDPGGQTFPANPGTKLPQRSGERTVAAVALRGQDD